LVNLAMRQDAAASPSAARVFRESAPPVTLSATEQNSKRMLRTAAPNKNESPIGGSHDKF
jgi:hypothetical protein